MDYNLPILSKAQLIAENEFIMNALNPEDVAPLVNRWLKEYKEIPLEALAKLTSVAREALGAKYMLAERLSTIFDENKDLFQRLAVNTTEPNGAVASTSSYATSMDGTDLTFSTGSGSSTASNPVTPTVATPTSANQLKVDPSLTNGSDSSTTSNPVPSTLTTPTSANQLKVEPRTCHSAYTTPTRWSNGSITKVRRISYDNVYCVDPRKRVLRELNRTANTSGSSTSTQSDSPGATPNESINDNIMDNGNHRYMSNGSEESQANSSMPSSPNDDRVVAYTVIGPNGTKVPTDKFNNISFTEAAQATRSLLMLVFSEEELATNTLSGKPSPAFIGRERPAKGQLDPNKVADIIHCMTSRAACTNKEVRNVITTKCADSTKRYRRLSVSSSCSN